MKFKVKKRFGQHFLINKDIVHKILSLSKINTETVIEIGPGFGALTTEIIKKQPSLLYLIEKDTSLKAHLENLTKDYKTKTKIIYDDALNIDLEKIYNTKKISLVANLPYNIATTLIINWLKHIHIFSSIIVMVQKEVADRLTARTSTSSYGRLSVLVQTFCKIEKKFDVEKSNFSPAPKITSSIIEIIPKKKTLINYQNLDSLLKISFFSRRKKIKNNLIKKYPNIVKVLKENNIDYNLRPQDFSPCQYNRLSRIIELY